MKRQYHLNFSEDSQFASEIHVKPHPNSVFNILFQYFVHLCSEIYLLAIFSSLRLSSMYLTSVNGHLQLVYLQN